MSIITCLDKKTKLKIVKWMVEQYDLDGVKKRLFSKAVYKFPMHFCATQYNSIVMKVFHIWKNMANILEAVKKIEELYNI
jgi:hypothetical protein